MSQMGDQNVRHHTTPVCKYHQLGFCKYGDQCHEHHINEICSKEICTNKDCRQRHPRTCRYYIRNMCKYKEKCAYKHQKLENHEEIQNLEEEIGILKIEIEKLSNITAGLADKLKSVESTNRELSDVQENVKHLSHNMSEMMVKMVHLEENSSNGSFKKDKQKVDKRYFNCDKCEFISTSNMSLKKHIHTKHPIIPTEMQPEDERSCYICGEMVQNAWDFLKHLEEHQERKERLFNCKLCSFTSIFDADIRDHMINHVENVLNPKLTQMEDKHEKELHDKLDSIKESVEDEYTENNEDKEINNKKEDISVNISEVDELVSSITKDIHDEEFSEEEIKMAEEYLAKCDQDGNYCG